LCKEFFTWLEAPYASTGLCCNGCITLV